MKRIHSLMLVLGLAAGVAVADPQPTEKPADKPVEKPQKRTFKPGEKKSAKLMVGDAAPPLTIEKWAKGEEVKSLEAGKVYVVEFWATWCGPCIRGIPHLTDLQKRYKDVVFIGVAASERADKDGPDKRFENVQKFVDKQGSKMDYRVAFDGVRAMSKAWMEAAGVNTIPHAFVVNHEGKIAYIGDPNDAAMETKLASVVTAAKEAAKKPVKPEETPKETKPVEKKPADAASPPPAEPKPAGLPAEKPGR